MQLDNTRIAIRERDMLDICDLALHVIRTFARPLMLALAVGIVPLAVLDVWLLRNLSVLDEPNQTPPEFLWVYLVLTLWQAPFACSLATLFLGNVMFAPLADTGQIRREFLRALGQMLFYEVFVRGLLMLPAAMCGLPSFNPGLKFLGGLSLVMWFAPYISWPFLNEVILLERNPFRATRQQAMSSWKRSSALHGGSFGDLLARWMAAVIFGCVIIGMLWGFAWIALAFVTRMHDFARVALVVLFPLALWLTVAYFAVVRFLCYLDQRIRREGWELELQMRAEGDRLTRQVTA